MTIKLSLKTIKFPSLSPEFKSKYKFVFSEKKAIREVESDILRYS